MKVGRKVVRKSLIIVGFFVLVAVSVYAWESSAVQETYVSSAQPAKNYGSRSELWVGYHEDSGAGQAYTFGQWGITAECPDYITKVELKFGYVISYGLAGKRIYVRRVDGEWTRYGLKWSNQPSHTEVGYFVCPTKAGEQTVEVFNKSHPSENVYETIKMWRKGYNNYGFCIRPEGLAQKGESFLFRRQSKGFTLIVTGGFTSIQSTSLGRINSLYN